MSTPIPAYRVVGFPLHSSVSSQVHLISVESAQPSLRLLVHKAIMCPRGSQELKIMRELTKWRNSSEGQALFPRLEYYQQSANCAEMVMEYCSGGDLAKEILERYGNRPSAVAARRLLIQLTDALQRLHSFGITHCDIKPHNVFLDARGTPLLGDFSHATRGGAEERQNDVYMLGCTFLEYFAGEVGLELNRLAASECCAKVASVLRTYPASFLHLLQAMLAFSPSQRISAQKAFELISSECVEEAEKSDCKFTEECKERVTDEIQNNEPSVLCKSDWSGSTKTISRYDTISLVPSKREVVLDQFAIDSASLMTVLECKDVDERLLRQKVEALLQWKRTHDGSISCEVQAEMFMCTHKWHSKFATKKAGELQCGCVYCKECLNEHVLASINGQPLSRVACTCRQTIFDPLGDAFRGALSPCVIERFDAEIISAFLRCPMCDCPIDEIKGASCRSLKCPNCHHKFCSFCLKGAHYIRCSKWGQHLKTLDKK